MYRYAPVACAFLLSACQTTSGTQANLTTIIAEAQAAAQAACSIVPAATAIASIVAAENGAVITATQIATALCSAVNARSTKFGAPLRAGAADTVTVVVNGKAIVVPYTRVTP